MRTRFVIALVLLSAFPLSEGVGASALGSNVSSSRPTLPTTAPANSVAESACSQASTVGIESCEVRQNLALNRTFDRDTTILWPMLDRVGRQEMAQAQKSWLSYVRDECDLEEREFLGGSIVPVIGEGCVNDLTRMRNQELAAAIQMYCEGSEPVGTHRLCPKQDYPHGGIGKG